MWVRSQDRKLLIYADRICMKKSYGYEIYQQDENGTITLGIYSSEQKALKVIDMIHDKIMLGSLKYEDVKSNDNTQQWLKSEFVFNMPADDEV